MLAIVSFSGCKKTIVPHSDVLTVEGTIVAYLFACQGNGILISVENIPNLGRTDSFMYNNKWLINYQNAIIVNHINDSIEGSNLVTVQIPAGGKLKFECRIITEADVYLFDHNEICLMNMGPPDAPYYIITKILNYQKPE